MKPLNIMRTAAVVVVGILAVGILVNANHENPSALADEKPADNESKKIKTPGDNFSSYVDKAGNISLPKGFKRKWAHLGSWAVATKPGNAVHELHDVYTQPETIGAYNQSGKFPDGTVLVKEVRETKADRLITGHATWSKDTKIWFVMIKDRQGRFKDNDHWGDGWGWALFEAKDPTKNVSAGYDTSCLSCHSPVEDSDWVYTYGYPELNPPK